MRLKENAPELDYSAFYRKSDTGNPQLCARVSTFLMTTFALQSTRRELLTVLQFPFRVGTPSLANIDSLSSRIEPFLEMSLEALEHLFFDVFDVGEPAPTSDIAVLRYTLNVNDKFFHEFSLVPVFFPEMQLANVRRLFLPVLGS